MSNILVLSHRSLMVKVACPLLFSKVLLLFPKFICDHWYFSKLHQQQTACTVPFTCALSLVRSQICRTLITPCLCLGFGGIKIPPRACLPRGSVGAYPGTLVHGPVSAYRDPHFWPRVGPYFRCLLQVGWLDLTFGAFDLAPWLLTFEHFPTQSCFSGKKSVKYSLLPVMKFVFAA